MGAIPHMFQDEVIEDRAITHHARNGSPQLGLVPTAAADLDPFSPDALASHRVNQDFEALVDAVPKIESIDVRKPPKQEWIRVRGGEEWTFETMVFEDERANALYMVKPTLRDELKGEIRPVKLFLTIIHGNLRPFLWPVRISRDGRSNSWNESALAAAQLGQSSWVRVVSDIENGQYRSFTTKSDYGSPHWPEGLTMPDYLRLAFKERLINDLDHPVIKRLRGQI